MTQHGPRVFCSSDKDDKVPHFLALNICLTNVKDTQDSPVFIELEHLPGCLENAACLVHYVNHTEIQNKRDRRVTDS